MESSVFEMAHKLDAATCCKIKSSLKDKSFVNSGLIMFQERKEAIPEKAATPLTESKRTSVLCFRKVVYFQGKQLDNLKNHGCRPDARKPPETCRTDSPDADKYLQGKIWPDRTLRNRNTIIPPVTTPNTGTNSTQAVVQANAVPTYAQIASHPPSPRPRSPALTRPTTPTGNQETVQTVPHSMHAPPEPATSLATPTSIAQDGYPDDGFTTVERRRKDKGKGKDGQVSGANSSGFAIPSTSAPFLRTPPRPTPQPSYAVQTDPIQQEGTEPDGTVTITSIGIANAPALTDSPAPPSNPPMPIPTNEVPPSNATSQPVSTPQIFPGTGMVLDADDTTANAPREDSRKRKRARVEGRTDEHETSRTTPTPAWDEGAPDVTMDASLSNNSTPSLTPQQAATSPPVPGQASTPRSRLPNFTRYTRSELEGTSGSTTSSHPSTSRAVNTIDAPPSSQASIPPPPPTPHGAPTIASTLLNTVPPVQAAPPPAQNPIPVNLQLNIPPNPVPPLNNLQGAVAAPPAGGYPDSNGFHAGNVFKGQSPQQVAMWTQIHGQRDGFLVRVFNASQDHIAMTNRITAGLQALLPNHTTPTVAPPERDASYQGRGPVHFFVNDMDPAAIQVVLQRRVVNTIHDKYP
ncbi:hypothetical protein K435DRAFT_902794 [Dendrothele bispora CBS 962.96]|uniref:Uncharacterized protein n=1 Tax=Dendrothele bispora (strain CBS 962.96) TaxID=1314807 RepID=A0A4V4HF67_DENBC|nr:hypothetical protein K435DRAFT_902794 [Dendrothele bispora CBS 962.96]